MGEATTFTPLRRISAADGATGPGAVAAAGGGACTTTPAGAIVGAVEAARTASGWGAGVSAEGRGFCWIGIADGRMSVSPPVVV